MAKYPVYPNSLWDWLSSMCISRQVSQDVHSKIVLGNIYVFRSYERCSAGRDQQRCHFVKDSYPEQLSSFCKVPAHWSISESLGTLNHPPTQFIAISERKGRALLRIPSEKARGKKPTNSSKLALFQRVFHHPWKHRLFASSETIRSVSGLCEFWAPFPERQKVGDFKGIQSRSMVRSRTGVVVGHIFFGGGRGVQLDVQIIQINRDLPNPASTAENSWNLGISFEQPNHW